MNWASVASLTPCKRRSLCCGVSPVGCPGVRHSNHFSERLRYLFPLNVACKICERDVLIRAATGTGTSFLLRNVNSTFVVHSCSILSTGYAEPA